LFNYYLLEESDWWQNKVVGALILIHCFSVTKVQDQGSYSGADGEVSLLGYEAV
jgi:hypothetical protein